MLVYIVRDHPFSTYAKFSENTNISYTLIRTHTISEGFLKISFFSVELHDSPLFRTKFTFS